MMKLAELEINRIDWSDLLCGCGESAGHLKDDLCRLISTDKENALGMEHFEGHLFKPSVLCEPAVATVSVILAALADRETPGPVRDRLLRLLSMVADGEGQDSAPRLQGRDLAAECVQATKPGIWLLYAEVTSGRSVDSASIAFETLVDLEEDSERLEYVRNMAGEFLSPDLR
jgi:hypothetical protein